MASSDILSLDPLNLLLEITKNLKLGKTIQNILRSTKNFQKYFMVHQYMPKISHGPSKNPPASPLHT